MFFALPQLRLRKNIFREVSENLTPNVITKDKCGKYAQKHCRPKAKHQRGFQLASRARTECEHQSCRSCLSGKDRVRFLKLLQLESISSCNSALTRPPAKE